MPDDQRRASFAEAPTTTPKAPQEPMDVSAQPPVAPEKAQQSAGRRWVRRALFLLLPLVLIAGGY